MKVQLFIPCFVDQLYPATAFNMVKVLEKLGCTVAYNSNQTCCGQPAFNAGFQDECKDVATKFLNDFSGTEYIVAPSASCAGFVRNYYGKIFDNSSVHNDVKGINKRLERSPNSFNLLIRGNTKLSAIPASKNNKDIRHGLVKIIKSCRPVKVCSLLICQPQSAT